MIDEPYPQVPYPSTIIRPAGAPPQILCDPAKAPCVETGTGDFRAYSNQPNMFLARQTGNRTVTRTGVPIDSSGPSFIRILRITNLRGNASSLGLATGLVPLEIAATMSITGSPQIVLQFPQQILAFALQAYLPSNGIFSQSACSPHNAALIGGVGVPAFDFNVRVREGFPSVFRRRNFGLTSDGATPPALFPQDIPGGGFLYFTESTFYVPSLFTGKPSVGLADFGTRVKITFSGVGSGVHLFVPLTITSQPSFGPQPGPPPITGISTNQLRLVQTAPDGSSSPGFTAVAATTTIAGSPVAEVTYVVGGAYAVYEVENSSAPQTETSTIPVAVAYDTTVTPGSGTVNVSLAPSGGLQSSIQSADILAPIPRFVDDSYALQAFSIESCRRGFFNSSKVPRYYHRDK
jgi:hypothetical protein